jgi:hypothetical protein
VLILRPKQNESVADVDTILKRSSVEENVYASKPLLSII